MSNRSKTCKEGEKFNFYSCNRSFYLCVPESSCTIIVYLGAECVFILRHYFTSKLFVAVHEAISSADPDKEVLSRMTVHCLVTKFLDKMFAFVQLF